MNKICFILALFLFVSCSSEEKSGLKFIDKGREVPAFNADSAYNFIEAQLAFGPRVPNTDAHQQALNYFESKFKQYAGNNSVFIQRFEAQGYNESLKLGNVIAAFNTSATDRIMLSAHWDSRPRADMDSVRTEEGILGADDGASGVGVLLELARIFRDNPPPVGVDIVLFDGEDYGRSGNLEKYFLGARHWSNNPPVPGYSPRFGILLDMVGGKDARFSKEMYSLRYAPNLVEEVWNIAEEKGYDQYFINKEGTAVADDHMIVNQQAGIPMINIIHHEVDEAGNANFPSYWHTHGDDITNISRETLQAVGDVVAELIYNRL